MKGSLHRLRWERILGVFFASAIIIALLLILCRPRNDLAALDTHMNGAVSGCEDFFEQKKTWISSHEKIELCVPKGKSFYELLSNYPIDPRDIIRIDQSIKPFYDLSKIKAGQKIHAWLSKNEGTIDKLSFELSAHKMLHVVRNGSEFFASMMNRPKVSVPKLICGEIMNSFYESALDKGMPPDIIMNIADVLAWDIDFLVDIRLGDRFQVILEQNYRKGICIGHGKILALRFFNQDKRFSAFSFTDSKGRSAFYDKNGKSLMKAFLKSPLSYRRISSYFSKRRFHPILKTYRPHYGVDYAAPVGTPVEAIGDGKITFIGRNGGYGRYIKVRHNHIYESAYGHLSRFAKGLKRGSKVKQGDIIGFVGSSGLSTGPHLDFSVKKNGRYINPLKIESPPTLRLSAADKEKFNLAVEHMERLWQEDQYF
ncbi:MAG: peptidoglycan DD-metalloendopeptidase family protein [Thermodesulfobacteriota bacterium]